jgi:hypothetical protein
MTEHRINDTAWPMPEILRELVRGADILLDAYDHDAHGWELIREARHAAKEWLKNLENFPSVEHKPGDVFTAKDESRHICTAGIACCAACSVHNFCVRWPWDPGSTKFVCQGYEREGGDFVHYEETKEWQQK